MTVLFPTRVIKSLLHLQSLILTSSLLVENSTYLWIVSYIYNWFYSVTSITLPPPPAFITYYALISKSMVVSCSKLKISKPPPHIRTKRDFPTKTAPYALNEDFYHFWGFLGSKESIRYYWSLLWLVLFIYNLTIICVREVSKVLCYNPTMLSINLFYDTNSFRSDMFINAVSFLFLRSITLIYLWDE